MASPTTQTPAADPIPGSPLAAPDSEAPARPSVGLLFLASLLTAGLLWCGFFPLSWGWLGWVALVPFLVLVRSAVRPRLVYLFAYVGGLAFFFPALQWMRVADPRMYVTWIALSFYCSLYFPLALAFLRRLDRLPYLPLTVTLPVVWTGLEFFRAAFIGGFASMYLGSHQHDVPGGFAWYFLGYTQHDYLEVIQIADLCGVYGVTFLLCAVNGLLFEVLFARSWFRRLFFPSLVSARVGRTALLTQGVAVFLTLLAVLAYGVVRLGQDVSTPGPRLALLQGNLDQRIRNDSSKSAQQTMAEHYGALARLAATTSPDLTVWPETSYPAYWEEMGVGVPDPPTQEVATRLGKAARSPVVLGVNSAVQCPDNRVRCYNSAVLVDQTGRWQARYDKIHRVPFGEYVPLRTVFPFLNALAPYEFDYSVQPGEQFTRFPLATSKGKYSFGVIICYEDTDPSMARPYGGYDGGPPTDFLLNISNDGWFIGTNEHDEHLAICRFRAVECRRAVCRAVNMGISAVIDGNGRVLRPQQKVAPPGTPEDAALWEVNPGETDRLPVSEWGQYKKVGGVLVGTVPLDTRPSLYARWGDWLPAFCGVAAFLGLIVGWVRPRLGGSRGETV